MVDYSPLWKTMKEKKVSQYRLIKSGISTKMIDYMKRNVQLFPDTIEQLKQILDCSEDEIVLVTPDVVTVENPMISPEKRYNFILSAIMSSFLVLLFQQIISYCRNRRRKNM